MAVSRSLFPPCAGYSCRALPRPFLVVAGRLTSTLVASLREPKCDCRRHAMYACPAPSYQATSFSAISGPLIPRDHNLELAKAVNWETDLVPLQGSASHLHSQGIKLAKKTNEKHCSGQMRISCQIRSKYQNNRQTLIVGLHQEAHDPRPRSKLQDCDLISVVRWVCFWQNGFQ